MVDCLFNLFDPTVIEPDSLSILILLSIPISNE